MKQDIIAINGIDEKHLKKVVAKMRKLGAPVIKAVWAPQYNAWVALEGSHRIAAANKLGLPITIEPVEYSNTLLVDLGIEDARYAYSTVEDYFDSAYQSADHIVTAEVTIK